MDNARTASKDSYIKVLHDRIHYLEQKLNQHDIAIQPFGSEASPVPEAHQSVTLPLSQVSRPTVDSPRVAGTNPSVVPLHRGSVSGTSPGSLDKDDAGRGITAMGTIAAEGEIDGSFDAFGGILWCLVGGLVHAGSHGDGKEPESARTASDEPPEPRCWKKGCRAPPLLFQLYSLGKLQSATALTCRPSVRTILGQDILYLSHLSPARVRAGVSESVEDTR
ncbi:fungal specific transcription factor [Seiridium cupressi]